MAKSTDEVPVIDLFAGPGGLGEGFSAFRSGGTNGFRIRLSIEKDPFARETLRLRAFTRCFERRRLPTLYYDLLRGESSLEDLYNRHPVEAEHADREAWLATLGEVPRPTLNERITTAIGGSDSWVLIGGPPCQAYSTVGRSRNRGVKGYRAEADHRQYLYVEYLQVIADHWPAIFVMENVKGLLSASVNNNQMFGRILEDLTAPRRTLLREGRTVSSKRNHTYRVVSVTDNTDNRLLFKTGVLDYLVQAEKHGIPQARHRVILVGIRDDLGEVDLPPLDVSEEVSVHEVLYPLPRLRSGLTGGDSPDSWLCAIRKIPKTPWIRTVGRKAGQRVEDLMVEASFEITAPRRGRGGAFIAGDFKSGYRPDWFEDGRLEGVSQHESRPHIESDLHRYMFVSCFGKAHGHSPRLRDFPKHLLPSHASVDSALAFHGYFQDRFRVQIRDRPATTITSHIAKDGHAYIHFDPLQCRSLTLREAARIQTFPDNYFFSGTRTRGYAQVGNAVPPLLALQIAGAVNNALRTSGSS